MCFKRTRQWLLVAATALLPTTTQALVAPQAPQQQRQPSSQLDAVSVLSEPNQGFTIIPVPIGGSAPRKSGWPRRLAKKVFRRSDRISAAYATAARASASTATIRDDSNVSPFVLSDFESLTPSQVLPLELLSTTDSSLPDTISIGTPPSAPTKSSPPLARYAETTLATLVHRWTQGIHSNLRVHCDPNGGVVDLVKGLFRADATISFDRLVFGAIRMSQGQLTSHRLALNVYKFAPLLHKRIPRFAQAFDLEAQDVTFTSRDLFESTCVRQGLRRLLTRILRNRGLMSSTSSKVEINSIRILPSGKLAIQGSATPSTLLEAAKVDFEVRSGLGTDRRGHVLTFPGLEISVGPPASVGLFVPVVPSLSLDMGHNFAISKVHLDKGVLQLSCRTTITPRHTRKLQEGQYHQDNNSFAASFHFDVGRWLTRIGNFSD